MTKLSIIDPMIFSKETKFPEAHLVHRWKDLTENQKYIFLFLAILVLRTIFTLQVGLIDDEAYHWSWAKDLMLSYYDHPGMIAWLNWISTSLFGDSLLGVRLPSFLCFIATVIMSFLLARDLFDTKAAVFTACMLLFTPFWGLGGFVASPEPPFMLCWVLAAWIFWQGVRKDGKEWGTKKTWLALGVVMGLGLNSKFIMALLAPGFGLYLMLTPERRRDLIKPWPWVGFLLAAVLCLPIFVWNMDFDWPGFRYQFHERHTGETLSPMRWLGWWGSQWGLLTPLLYPLLILSFIVAIRKFKEPNWRFIFCLTAPSFLVFYPQPLWADYKPHWSGPAYLILTMGVGALWSQGLEYHHQWVIRPKSQRIKRAFLWLLIPINLIIYSPFIYPWWPKAYRLVNPEGEWNPRWDLSNEFSGWEELGQYLNRRVREIHSESGQKPFVAALRYETTAQTYWGTKQKVYMLSLTKSHYTVVHRKRQEWQQLQGRDALVVTTEKYQANPMEWGSFSTCAPEEYRTYRADELSRIFVVWYCKNFQGILK